MLDSLAADMETAFVTEFIGKAVSQVSLMTAEAQRRCEPTLVRRGIELARGYGILGRFDIERFLYIYIELAGTSPLANVWASRIMEDPSLSAGYKVDQLEGQFALLRR